MAGNQIGPLTAKVIANSDGLDADLQKAEAKVITWAEGLKAKVSTTLNIGKSLSGFAERAMTDPGRTFAEISGAIGNLASRVPLLGGLLAAPFEGVTMAATAAMDLYDKGAERITNLGKAAAQAGMPLGEFQVIAQMMGGDADRAALMIDHLQRSLNEARGAALGADNVFRRLSLDPFATQGNLAGLGATFDAIRALPTAAAQAQAIRDLYGRTADKYLIGRGSAGIDKTAGLMDAFGARYGDGSMETIRQAQQATREFKLLWQGLETQVTVGLAPVFAGLADVLPRLADMGVSFRGLSDTVFQIAKSIVTVGASIIDLFDQPAVALERLGQVWEDVKARLIQGAEAIGEAMGKGFRSMMPSLDRWTQETFFGFNEEAYRREWAEIQKKAGVVPQAGSGFFSGLGMNGDKNFIGPPRPTLADQVLDSIDRAQQKMRESRRVGEESNPFTPWIDSLERLGKQLETPFDKLKGEWQDFKRRIAGPENAWFGPDNLQEGLKALALVDRDKGLFGQKLLAGLRSAAGSSGPLGSQFVGAAEAGSREAYSAILQYTSARESIEEEMARLLEESKQIQEQHLAEGKRAVDALMDLANNLKVGGDW